MRSWLPALAAVLTIVAGGATAAGPAQVQAQPQAPPLLPPLPPLVPDRQPREPLFPAPLPRLPLPTIQIPEPSRLPSPGSAIVCGIRVVPVTPDVDPKFGRPVPRGDARSAMREAPVPAPCSAAAVRR